MATDVTLIDCSPSSSAHDRVARDVRSMFLGYERRYSRFDPASELSRLNRAHGHFTASRELFSTLVTCRALFVETRGLFDPTIASALAAQGYDRSIEEGSLDRDEPASRAHVPTMDAVSLDPSRRSVTLHDGAQLDLGGIAKGLCIDECAAFLPANCALDAGGDVVLRGRDDEALPWLVEIEDPRDASQVIAKIEATDVCVATSASNRRRWKRGDRARHHIVDPRTGASAESDLLQVTVLDASAARAEAFSKSALIAGLERAVALLGGARLRAVLVSLDGALTSVGDVEFVCE